jgi:hypothetical protein
MMKVLDYLKTSLKLSQRAALLSPTNESATAGHRIFLLVGLSIGALLLGACSILSNSGSQDAPLLSSHETPFLPPTLAFATPRAVSQTQASVKAQQPTQAPLCSDNLTYLSDLSIKDGSVFPPGAQLDKRWSVENSGTCNWNQSYRMKLIAGSQLGVLPEQALYPARSGSQAIIRIVFTAPAEPGNYRSAWQAYNSQGEPFGDPFFIDIVVVTVIDETPTTVP